MSVTNIPEKVKIRLWGLAAGRCQYEGCNEPLWLDTLTQHEFNGAYIAHIIADSPNGPRGDAILSEQLEKDISNLMLMCDKHHRLIDREDVEGHPVERLREMKRKHEQRIQLVTSILDNMQSHVLLYGSNIGQHSFPLNWDRTTPAMLSIRYPAEKPAIEISLGNSSIHDGDELFWVVEREQLRRQFSDKVKRRIALGDICHLSVFALAPQPLLIELGTLISDICPADVYQLHREPADWVWQEDPADFKYIINEPDEIHQVAALNLSLSATIDNTRIFKVLGSETSVWTVTIQTPHNDFMKSKQQLSMFREIMRRLLDKIKAVHGHDNMLHVFPAMPVSAAVELGRIWMPKADLPLCIYDENRQLGGFKHTLSVGIDSGTGKEYAQVGYMRG
ncbi:SAVED domain-containing protein [Paenibacillus sp. p3-SID1389]|uniref:SAVED domain-containing protein n=1 Tax=Paenibacillus sp. p3-SID1389 TaxID=2916364 RepID=UPI0021A2FB95|nr:SAVED domain-containing protein [Paenibacillus sp. p3-SID1389]MCT2195992.1 SAVED domain-containing protein [Paenibacillus sp. p3-SID1389]